MMTSETSPIIRALTNQNNELSVEIRDALVSAGYKAPGARNATIRDYVRALISAFNRQSRIKALESAQESIRDRTIFIRVGKRLIRLNSICYVEFGARRGSGLEVAHARVSMDNGTTLTLTGAHANNLFRVMTKVTGESYYDIHHLVDISISTTVKRGTKIGPRPEELSEDDELHSADGEFGADISGGETA